MPENQSTSAATLLSKSLATVLAVIPQLSRHLSLAPYDHSVRAKLGFEFAGQGFHSGRVGTKAEFKVWTKGDPPLSFTPCCGILTCLDENNKPADIDVYALEVHVEGPGGKDTGNVFSDGPGVYVCTYIVTAPGNYEVKVKYDDNVVATKNVPFSDGNCSLALSLFFPLLVRFTLC